jgi:hypothetical protein
MINHAEQPVRQTHVPDQHNGTLSPGLYPSVEFGRNHVCGMTNAD